MTAEGGSLLFAVAIFLPVLLLVSKSFVIIGQDQLGIMLRLGLYRATLLPGFHLRIPLIDIVRKVDSNSNIPRWEFLSPNQRVSAAQSFVLLGKVDLNFKLDMKGDKVQEKSLKSAERSLSSIPRTPELDRLVEWLTEKASQQTGVKLARDTFALVRLTEAANRVLGSLSSSDTFLVDIPYITADASGPKHVNLTMTRAEVDAVLKKRS
jgi:hypothetical protein